MLMEIISLIIIFFSGLLIGMKIRLDPNKALENEVGALREQVKQINEQDKMLKNAKQMLVDMKDMNDTTVKLNDFYSSKIGKIQAVLNEKG